MFTKKLFPIARSKKDWQRINEKLNFVFFMFDNLQELNYDSDEFEYERHEINTSKALGILSEIRQIAEAYQWKQA